MASDLKGTWNDMATRMNDWGPPLRPSPEDAEIAIEMLRAWRADPAGAPSRVFLCGVTPEITLMRWPFPIELLAMDQAESMVRVVWPGDVPGLRRAVVGNWQSSGLPDRSFDVVVGDGGFGFFSYPEGMRDLLAELHRILRPGGLFLYRHFAQGDPRESVAAVLEAARRGGIGSFHAFKWRIAMAIQGDSANGACQNDIWETWHSSGIDPRVLPQPGWSTSAVSTIDFYKGKSARLFFPTLDELRLLMARDYQGFEARAPHYELGERCPTIAARAR
jgi:SAM-dependent methyltransferase